MCVSVCVVCMSITMYIVCVCIHVCVCMIIYVYIIYMCKFVHECVHVQAYAWMFCAVDVHVCVLFMGSSVLAMFHLHHSLLLLFHSNLQRFPL